MQPVSVARQPTGSICRFRFENRPCYRGSSTLELQGEDEIQILASARHKGAALFCGAYLKLAVGFGYVVFSQAASRVAIRRNPTSCGSRPCQVEKLRSRACGALSWGSSVSPNSKRYRGLHLVVMGWRPGG